MNICIPYIEYYPKNITKNDIINIVNDNFIPNYAWKDYQFLQIYNEQLNAKFSNHEFSKIADEENLIETFNIITSSATYAFNRRYRNNNNHISFSRPWWTPELTRCKNILSFHFNKWRENNFSKAENCVAFNRYQIARKNFRRAVKEAQNKK